MTAARFELDLGPGVVTRLLPQRRPFLFVDRIRGFRGGARPRLWAERCISANDPVFDGHFPGVGVWPGVLTIEGLGQSTGLLSALLAIGERLAERGHPPELLLESLGEIERRATLRPHDASRIEHLDASLAELGASLPIGLGVAIDVKLAAPVFGGQVLHYEVERSHVHGDVSRFEVLALVAGREVARGVMKGCFRHVLAPAAAAPTAALASCAGAA